MHEHFEGTLTARDCKRHIPFRFDVPEGAGSLDVDLTFEPARAQSISNRLTLTLFDPDGFRGAGHRGGASHRVHIDAGSATPGYHPGPLPSGEWTVEIDTHMIMPGEPVRFRLEVATTEGGDPGAVRGDADPEREQALSADGPAVPGRGAGWYRGDLHTHSHHSDAEGCTLDDMIALAREFELDFFFLTDHNTNAGLGEIEAAPAPPLICRGFELTTFWGHALCLGTDRWVEWRIRPNTGAMARIAAEAEAVGEIFIIAHPESHGDPGCTGCTWRFGGMMPGNARFVEIWNGPWDGDSRNEMALSLWYDWLNQGLRVTATAGTDVHGQIPQGVVPGFNVIHAEALSEAALLDGLRAGHLYLSAGPSLALEARDDGGRRAMMGDTAARPVELRTAWEGAPAGAQVRVIVNGRPLRAWEGGPSGAHAWRLAPAEADWTTVELRDRGGTLLAVTNPIYFESARAQGSQ